MVLCHLFGLHLLFFPDGAEIVSAHNVFVIGEGGAQQLKETSFAGLYIRAHPAPGFALIHLFVQDIVEGVLSQPAQPGGIDVGVDAAITQNHQPAEMSRIDDSPG